MRLASAGPLGSSSSSSAIGASGAGGFATEPTSASRLHAGAGFVGSPFFTFARLPKSMSSAGASTGDARFAGGGGALGVRARGAGARLGLFARTVSTAGLTIGAFVGDFWRVGVVVRAGGGLFVGDFARGAPVAALVRPALSSR